jgi:hypothetical protein
MQKEMIVTLALAGLTRPGDVDREILHRDAKSDALLK